GAIQQLEGVLGVNAADTVEDIERELERDSLIAAAEWPAIVSALAEGSKSDVELAVRIQLMARSTGADRYRTCLEVFCTQKLQPQKSLVTKAIEKKYPDLAESLKAEQERFCKLLGRRLAINVRDRTRALITIADEVLRRYNAEKDRRGLLDYDD